MRTMAAKHIPLGIENTDDGDGMAVAVAAAVVVEEGATRCFFFLVLPPFFVDGGGEAGLFNDLGFLAAFEFGGAVFLGFLATFDLLAAFEFGGGAVFLDFLFLASGIALRFLEVVFLVVLLVVLLVVFLVVLLVVLLLEVVDTAVTEFEFVVPSSFAPLTTDTIRCKGTLLSLPSSNRISIFHFFPVASGTSKTFPW